MVYKLVFQVPYDEGCWDPGVAAELRMTTPGDPDRPHVQLYPGQTDREIGAPCALICCKDHSVAELERLVARVLTSLGELTPDQDRASR